jgi:hypothetical protein
MLILISRFVYSCMILESLIWLGTLSFGLQNGTGPVDSLMAYSDDDLVNWLP